MARKGKPIGRIDGGTLSVGADTVSETISVGDTHPSTEITGDFAELRSVPRSNYIIGEPIAQGGMGVILDARDRRTGRPLAIKEVRADVMERDPAAVRAAVLRFRREALLSAQLQHPAIVPVYEIGRFDQVPFIAMKRVSGTPLDKLIDRCKSEADRLALLPKLIAVADAVAYAHSEGVIHRDIKPANVLVGDFGETILIDWGLAKKVGSDEMAVGSAPPALGLETVAGAVFGTPQYMAPEQAAGGTVGPGADVYALGAILYELLTAEAPYSSALAEDGDGATAGIIERVCAGSPPPITDFSPEAPADLVSIANKAMTRRVEDRYASASELAADLEAFERGQLVAAHEYSLADRLRRWMLRRRAAVITGALLLVLGAATTTWFVLQTIAARDDALIQRSRAAEELANAMTLLRERGFSELDGGNRARAATSLAASYRRQRDRPLAFALGDLMKGIDPFSRLLAISTANRGRARIGVAIDTDNDRLAITADGKTRITDLSGALLFEVDGTSPRFADRGRAIVTISGDGVHLWSREGRAVKVFRGAQDFATGRRTDVLLIDSEDDLGVFSSSDGERRRHVVRPRSNPRRFGSLSLSDDGNRAVELAPLVRVIDPATGSSRDIEQTGAARFVAISHDGEQIAFSPRDGLIVIVESGSGATIKAFAAHGRRLDMIAFSEDGATLASIDTDGGLCFTGLVEFKPRCRLEAGATSVVLRGDLVVTGHWTGSVRIWDRRGRLLGELAAHGDGETTAELVAEKDLVVTSGAGGVVRAWSLEKSIESTSIIDASVGEKLEFVGATVFVRGERRTEFFPLDRPAQRVAIAAPRGGRAQVSRDGSVMIVGGAAWRRDGTPLPTIEALRAASTLALAPSGERLATCQPDGRLDLIDVATQRVLWSTQLSARESAAHEYAIRSLHFSPSGAKLAVAVLGRDLVYDAASGAEIADHPHPRRSSGESSSSIVFLRDETRMVSATNDELVLWSARGVEQSVEINARPYLALAPSGARVVVAIGDRVGFFGAEDGQAIEWLRSVESDRSAVVAIAISPAGFIAVATMAGRVEIFDESGLLLATRLGAGIRFLRFEGDKLVADSGDSTFIWSFELETRAADEVAEKIAEASATSESAGGRGEGNY